ncbi:MAG: SDR family oxidoreductase [Pseudomonadota bacterium]
MNDTVTLTLVTGGTSGIGLATAKEISRTSRPGDCVLVTGRTPARFESAMAAIKEAGPAEVIAQQCDHSDVSAVEALCGGLQAKTSGGLRVVANVGWNPVHDLGPSKTQNVDLDVMRRAMEVNVIATTALIAGVLPIMRAAGGGSIVLVGSQAYRFGIPGQLAYNTSKAALVGLKNTVVQEYARNGVRCDLVNPGIVQNARTERFRARAGAAQRSKLVSEEVVASAIVHLLDGQLGAPNGQEVNI